MTVPAWQTTVLFDGWYQDGTGHTWVDDNQGDWRGACELQTGWSWRVDRARGELLRDADLNLQHLKKSYGAGLRVHNATATLVRLDVGRDRPGRRRGVGRE